MDPETLERERPCDMAWHAMPGTDQRRHCAACGEDVFDLSAMTEADAEALMADDVHRCIRYTIGADGRVEHRAEPPRRRSRWRRRAVALIAGVGIAASVPAMAASHVSKEGMVGLVQRVRQWIGAWWTDEPVQEPTPAPEALEREVLGGAPRAPEPPPERVVLGGRPPLPRMGEPPPPPMGEPVEADPVPALRDER